MLLLISLTANAAGLNDTGQTACYDAANAITNCSASAGDGHYGRDAAAATGKLPKVGAGIGGFDYTKIGNSGNVLAANTALGSNPTDWACTLDNLTGLTWEIKTASGADMRSGDHTYTWYSLAANNGGNPGSVGTVNTCSGTLVFSACNTTSYAQAVNSAALCGYTDWRLPTVKELQSLVHFGASGPAGDPTYFPDTHGVQALVAPFYWSATNFAADATQAWTIVFDTGRSFGFFKSADGYVRLVRGGQ